MAWRWGTIQERLQGIRTETNTAQGTYTKNLAGSIYAYKTVDQKDYRSDELDFNEEKPESITKWAMSDQCENFQK